jgi:dGTPase
MIDRLVTDLIENTRSELMRLQPLSIEDVRQQPRPIVRFSDRVFEEHTQLKRFLNENLYRHDKVRIMTDRAKVTVRELFDQYMRAPVQMAPEFLRKAEAGRGDEGRKARVVADYIAGMTDRFAIAEHERLTGT